MRRPTLSNLCLTVALFFPGLTGVAQSQQPPVIKAEPLQLTGVSLDNLQTLFAGGKVAATTPLEINVSAIQLQQNNAVIPLQTWVRDGGIVLLHTDAAQFFGFKTVPPRQRTQTRAGQMWGRAANALPFGGHPLLWGGKSNDETSRGLPGVRAVFYHLDVDEALLSTAAPIVPLLRVQETTSAPNNRQDPTVYASGARRFGRGWAIFAPRHIEDRGDGPQFVANLTRFMNEAKDGKWASFPATLLQQAYQTDHPSKWRALLETLQPKKQETAVIQPDIELPVAQNEIQILTNLWTSAEKEDAEEEVRTSANGLLYLLLARSAWLSDSDGSQPSAPVQVAAL